MSNGNTLFSDDPAVRQARLFNQVLEHYGKYFRVENLVAYIEGRDYTMVGAFFYVLEQVLSADTDQELAKAEQKINDLASSVELFMRECKRNFPDLVTEQQCTQQYSITTGHDVIRFHAQYMAWLSAANCRWQAHFRNKAQSEVMLIEFNNYLSHLVVAGTPGKYTGLGHIYRAILDLYKEILLTSMSRILASKDRLAKYSQLRNLESEKVGATYEEKEEIIKGYKSLVAN